MLMTYWGAVAPVRAPMIHIIMAVLLAAVSLVGELHNAGSALAGSPPALQPGPGLGPSRELPSGEPVALVLPPGYTLEWVHGDSGDVPARGGAFDLALVVS